MTDNLATAALAFALANRGGGGGGGEGGFPPTGGVKYADLSTALKSIINEKYVKPESGIPATDLAEAVQESLAKADSALQEHQSIAGLQTSAIADEGNYFTTDTVESALQEIGAELAGVNSLIGSGEV